MKQSIYLEDTIATYVYSHYNICNIQHTTSVLNIGKHTHETHRGGFGPRAAARDKAQ
jgi:hypothetical protein